MLHRDRAVRRRWAPQARLRARTPRSPTRSRSRSPRRRRWRRVRPARARAGRRGRRDHPVERPLGLIAHKIGPALLAGCTVVLKVVARGARRGLRRRRGRGADRAAAGRAQRASPPTARCRSCSSATRASTRSRSPARPRRAGEIASICGERIARCTLELGGKSAAVILDDADIDGRGRDARRRRVRHDRPGVLVAHPHRRHPRRATTRWSRRSPASFAQVRVGDPFDEETQMGPLAAERQRDRVEGYIAKGVDEGATLADRRRPARSTSTAAGSSSRPCSATSTTRRRSPRRRSSARCSA